MADKSDQRWPGEAVSASKVTQNIARRGPLLFKTPSREANYRMNSRSSLGKRERPHPSTAKQGFSRSAVAGF